MKSLNQVTLMGNLVRDPEMRTTPSGQNVCNFSMALNRGYKDKSGQWQEQTDYVNCVAWGALGDKIVRNMHKGSKMLAVGTLHSSSWEQDGQKRSKLEVYVNDANFETVRMAAPVDSIMGTEDIDDKPLSLEDIPF